MKQGSGNSSSGGQKREPSPKAVTPARTNQYGESVAFQKDAQYAGRGFSAPHDASRKIHNGGSQGRH